MKDIFLCHTGADKEWVEKLAERLEAQTVGDRRLSVWFDKWDIEGGANILSKIEEGLKQSRFVGVVLSPAMTRAEWPTLEWQTQVFDDPAGKRGRIVPLLRHVFDPITHEPIEIPLPLKILKRFDFSSDRRFDDEFDALVRHLRGEAPLRGRGSTSQDHTHASTGADEPDEVSDSLITNLLPVTELPPLIYSDESVEATANGVIERVHPEVPWLLSGGRLHSFCDHDASHNPFAAVLSGRLRKKHNTLDWLRSDDRSPSAIRLLNDALRNHCRSHRISLIPGIKTKDQFFFAVTDGKPRQFRWSASARPRTLAKIVSSSSGESFGVHHAASIRFINLSGSVFLLLQPGWTFTSDGKYLLAGKQVGQLAMRWSGRERNSAVLRNTLMWALLLSGGKPEIVINVGCGSVLRIAAVPAHTAANVGITGDLMGLTKILGGEGGGETQDDEELDRIAELRGLSLATEEVLEDGELADDGEGS